MKNSFYKVQVITPVHVGNGKQFIGGWEIQHDKDFAYVVNPNIAFEGFDSNRIEAMCKEILKPLNDRESNQFNPLNTYLPLNTVQKSYLRKIKLEVSRIDNKKQIREQINTLNDKSEIIPYIPGSSIKGAITTALFSTLVDESVLKNDLFSGTRKSNKTTTDDKIMEGMFGDDPKSNVMRFLRIGDVNFKNNATAMYSSGSLVKSKRNDDLDNDNPNLVIFIEALAVGQTTRCKINYSFFGDEAKELSDLFNQSFKGEKTIMEKISSPKALADLINAHQQNLLNFEIERSINLGIGWVEELKKIKALTNKTDGSFVLRLGFGNGYDAMTGGLLHKNQSKQVPINIQKNFVEQIGHSEKNKGDDFSTYPRGRRFIQTDKKKLPMGFLLFTPIAEEEYDVLGQEKNLSSTNTKISTTQQTSQQPIEPAKPTVPQPFKGKFKLNINVPAQYIGPSDKTPNKRLFQLLVEGQDKLVAELTYNKEPELNSYHIITVVAAPSKGGYYQARYIKPY